MLEGRLGDFTLADILRLLSFTAKSGRLWVVEGDVEARVDVLEGRVRDATADTRRLALARRLLGQELVDADTLRRALEPLETLPGELELARQLVEIDQLDAGLLADTVREQTVDALFDLLRWPEGAFRFEARVAPRSGPSLLDLALSVDELLDEVGRRLEAHEATAARTGPAEAVVTIRRPGRERAEVALGRDGWTLLALVDGHRTVGDLVRLSGQGEYRTRRTLASLMDEGIVAIGHPSEPSPAERLVAAHRDLAELEARLGGRDRPPPRLGGREPHPASPDDGGAPEAPPPEPPVDRPGAGEAHVGPEPSPRRSSSPAEAPGAEEPAGDDHAGSGSVPSLRAREGRAPLRTDPDVDEDLVQRLIDGVEKL